MILILTEMIAFSNSIFPYTYYLTDFKINPSNISLKDLNCGINPFAYPCCKAPTKDSMCLNTNIQNKSG